MKYLSFAFKIGKNNQETPISWGYHSRSKWISWRNHGFTTRRRAADEEVTDKPNKSCIAIGNENEKGETNNDIDAINLLNAKDFKNTT